jgi:hypothetical protein
MTGKTDDLTDYAKTVAKNKAGQATASGALEGGVAGARLHKGVEQLSGEPLTSTPGDLSPSQQAEQAILDFTGEHVDVETISSVISESFIGILASLDGILAFKDIYEDKVATDPKNVMRVARGLGQLAIAGLKITSTLDDKLGISSNLLSFVPGLGVAISCFKVAEDYFTMCLAEASKETMKNYVEAIAPNGIKDDKSAIFKEYESKVGFNKTTLKKVNPKFYEDAQQSLDSGTITISFNSEYGTKIDNIEALQVFLDELRTYSLMVKLQEIDFKKKIKAAQRIFIDNLTLTANIAFLIPGGQFVTAVAMIAAGSIGVLKAGGVAVKKIYEGDDVGLWSGTKGKEKNAEYVMSVKKIIEMYSSIADSVIVNQDGMVNADITEEKKAEDKKAEQQIPKLEQIVLATGAYPPAVYKEAEKDPEGYKSVDKLVSAMKKR